MDPLRCAHCQDIVGVYEPVLLILSNGSNRRGSALTLGDQLDAPGSIVVHEQCYEAFENGWKQKQRDGTEP